MAIEHSKPNNFDRERFSYKKSESSRRPYDHIDLEVAGKLVGRAKIKYSDVPFSMYWIHDLKIQPQAQGEGYGSKVMEHIESILLEKNVAGVLLDNISENSPAYGMYERRGWIKVPGSKYGYAFNLPTGSSAEQLKSFVE